MPHKRFAVACAALAALAAAPVLAHPHPDAEAGQAEPASGEKFVRFVEEPDGDGGTLETAVVRYANDAGQRVDLIGAVHIADRAYFHALNRRFQDYDALLYEMVKPEGAAPPMPGRKAGADQSMIANLQLLTKQALELDYQLDGVDYQAENFVHADLDAETFTRLQIERDETFLDLLLRSLLNPPEVDPDQPQLTLVDLMNAFQAPDRARQLKLLMAGQMRQIDQMLELFDGGDGEGSVIIDERNKAAFEVLDEQLADGAEDVGVFYGAAHLPDMERRLIERGFEQVGEPAYLIAWDMTARRRRPREAGR